MAPISKNSLDSRLHVDIKHETYLRTYIGDIGCADGARGVGDDANIGGALRGLSKNVSALMDHDCPMESRGHATNLYEAQGLGQECRHGPALVDYSDDLGASPLPKGRRGNAL
ncbi:hypothetical protein TRAPUB_4279 [Trametes pubescens]|uniref:Uncharacterized protein n=1 Tax=Trametes pubescens TaxID=154538 RepID=A0A1M2VBM5_TRAPU|nr:hypothetical protein TRAPUB_4279 [Trametes pubescens]